MADYWYGKGERAVEVASATTAVWYHPGLPPVPLRWVLVRDPQEKFEPQKPSSSYAPISPPKRRES